jgi:hypothetical protein
MDNYNDAVGTPNAPTTDVWPAPPTTATPPEGLTLQLDVAGVVPIDTPGSDTKIGLALMADGAVRWVKLPDDEDV